MDVCYCIVIEDWGGISIGGEQMVDKLLDLGGELFSMIVRAFNNVFFLSMEGLATCSTIHAIKHTSPSMIVEESSIVS